MWVLSEVLIVTLKVRASLLSGCLHMMITHTAQSRPKMTTATMTPACPASSASKEFDRIMHSTVIRTAAERREGEEDY